MIADTTHGRVEGIRADATFAFLGLPYAEQPSGPLRFLAPRPLRPWAGVRPAHTLGPAAPQAVSGNGRRGWGFDLPPTSEECLTLNVWTAGAPGSRPVLVWIHGGGYSTGSSGIPIYDGAALAARHDVVVVTVSHRLGIFGFLELEAELGPEYAGSGNASMLDLVAALEWVRDNVAAFGGDPARVLVFGESGGGGKVLTLLAMPAAAGLFRAAAVQSGVYFHGPGGRARNAGDAESITAQVVTDAGGAARLKRHPADELMRIQHSIEARRTRGTTEPFAFAPLVDGRVLPDHPLSALAGGASADIPLVIGSTTDEPTFFAADPAWRRGVEEWTSSEEALRARVASFAPGRELLGAYRALKLDASLEQLLVAIVADQFRLGAIEVADTRCAAGAAPTFVYLFAWQSPIPGIGAGHTVELPLLFHTFERSALTRGGKGADKVASTLSDAWVALARTGSPSTPGLPWPAYDTDRRPTMLFDVDSGIVDDPLAGERRAWLP